MQKLLIVGLGNPGSQYAFNRHNIGFMVLDALAQKLNVNFCENKNLKSYIALHQNAILCKPTTFMNHSGEAVRAVRDYYKLEDLIVIHDELEIAKGALRFKKGGGHGGHNGLKSIDAHCGNEYVRARCGIGRPASKELVASYVLSDFTDCTKDFITHCTEALMDFIQKRDLQSLQNAFTLKGQE